VFTIEQCRKHLKSSKYSDKDIEEIRDGLYKAAEIAVNEHINNKGNNNDNRKTNRGK
jgi:hypothetical protein